jgi:predicted deacylase
MLKNVTVGTATAAPGTKTKGVIEVAPLATGEMVTLPVHIINGAKDGPRLWVNAAIHGNEFNGVISALRLVDKINPAELSGVVIITPISNPLAFFAKTRFTPHDGGNLGESYPGKPVGPITKQIAYHHFNEIKQNADYLIDLHASGVTNCSKSYSVLKYAGHPATEKRALELLLANGIHLNCSVDTLGKNDEPVPLTGSLDMECMALGIPSFMLELGHANRVEEEIVQSGLFGLENSMRHLGMVEGEVTVFADQIVTTERFIVRCTESGLAVQACKPHDYVNAGDILTRIYDSFGTLLEEVRAEKDMHIISLKEDCVATSGDRVVFGAA